MKSTIARDTMLFLEDLRKNNNREWFNRNKERFTEANEDFIDVVQSLIDHVSKFDKSVAGVNAKHSVFRIYRDTRFSGDKSPYKTHFGASLSRKGPNCGLAGYYIHLQPGESFIAGGVHMMEQNQLKAIREEISAKGKEFLKIIDNKGFRKNFTLAEQN